MEQRQFIQLNFIIKQLNLSIKFPCKLSFVHAGQPIIPEIEQNGKNMFTINKEIGIRQDRNKEHTEITVNLTTDRGGNIMAGVLKLSFKDLHSAQGQTMVIALQKCLDPQSSCLIYVKSVKMIQSRVKKGLMQSQLKNILQSSIKLETKSQFPTIDAIKQIKLRYNDTDTYISKRVGTNNLPYASNSLYASKVTNGFKNTLKQQFHSKFKHLSKKVEEEDNNTLKISNKRQIDQTLKSTIEIREKHFKEEITKYKSKHQQSERNCQDKTKQIKSLKDQISDLLRQVNQKQYILEQLNEKNIQINRVDEHLKELLKQSSKLKERIIEIEQEKQDLKNSNLAQITMLRQSNEKRQYQLQKSIYQKNEEIKEAIQQVNNKASQIVKIKILIEDLQKIIQDKTYEYDIALAQQKQEHFNTKNKLGYKISEMNNQMQTLINELKSSQTKSKAAHNENQHLTKKIRILQQSLTEMNLIRGQQTAFKQILQDEKRKMQKYQDQLHSKIKMIEKEKDFNIKSLDNLTKDFSEQSVENKKKIQELIEKNKSANAKNIELEQKIFNIINAEEKLKRNLQKIQKQLQNIHQSEKNMNNAIKLKDERILKLQKEKSDLQQNNLLREHINKKEAENKNLSIQRSNKKFQQLELIYQLEMKQNEQNRLKIHNLEQKMQSMNDKANQLINQARQTKQLLDKKQEQINIYTVQSKQKDQIMEDKLNEFNKKISQLELEKMNRNNQLLKAKKDIQSLKDKIDKSTKREIEIQKNVKILQKQIEEKEIQLINIEANYLNLENDYKLIQADKSKHQKIAGIINEERESVKQDVGKLKKEIEKRGKKQEQYLNEMKLLKQEIVKIQVKNISLIKQSQRFRKSIIQTVRNSLIVKPFALEDRKQSLTFRKMSDSRTSLDISGQFNINDYIQNFSREMQTSTSILSEQLKKIKKIKQGLQRQNQTLSKLIKQSGEQKILEIEEMQIELDTIIAKSNFDNQEFEYKIKQLNKTIKTLEQQKKQFESQMQQLSNTLQIERQMSQLNKQQLQSKIQSLQSKIVQSNQKEENYQKFICKLEQNINASQNGIYELQLQLEDLNQQIIKQNRIIIDGNQEIQQLKQKLQKLKRQKSELILENLNKQERISFDHQKIEGLDNELKEEIKKKSELFSFNNELLKAKQEFIKTILQNNQQISDLQQKIKAQIIQNAEKDQIIKKNQVSALTIKESCKNYQTELSLMHKNHSDIQLQLQRQKQIVKSKERKIMDQNSLIEQLNKSITKLAEKHSQHISQMQQEIGSLNIRLNQNSRESRQKTLQKQSENKQLKEIKQSERQLKFLNQSLEEQLFFEKQNHSIELSKFGLLRQEIEYMNKQFSIQVVSLKEEVKQKQEVLEILTRKLYISNMNYQNRQIQHKEILERLQTQWQYKINQLCQYYEEQLSAIEKQKDYVKEGSNQGNLTILRLQKEKNIFQLELQKEKQIWESKIKKVQDQKIGHLNEKNRQIEKLRQNIGEMEQIIKMKDFQLKKIEQKKKKCEQASKILQSDRQRCQLNKINEIKLLQTEIQQLKKKQGQLKRFKESLKNHQWTTEREIKKQIQSSIKSISSLNQTVRPKIIEAMHILQENILKLNNQNIVQI